MAVSTARKLKLATALLVATFAGASFAAVAGLAEIHRALHQVRDKETGVRRALMLSAAVRDQYAHQAHTIILGDTSHLPLYEGAHRRLAALLDEVGTAELDAEERKQVDSIRAASGEIDRLFRERILPAVQRGDKQTVLDEHARLLGLVTQVQESSDALATRYESAMSNFEEHAAVIQHGAFLTTIIFVAGAILLAVGVSAFIGRAVTRPLARLEAGAAQLALGDLDARIDLDGPDEFGRLARQINVMSASLKDQRERLIQTEKIAGIGRLAAGVAHEINNPIGVILGYARVLQRTAVNGQREDLKVIEDEALRCRDIVDGLLDLARPLKVGGDTVQLRPLAEEVTHRLTEAAPAPGPKFVFEGSASVEGNADRLRQLLSNLLKNATEAAGEGGTVTVAFFEDGDRASVRIRDSGSGLPPEAHGKLFEPFFTTKSSGTGLGLAISRAIAQAHRGDIRAANGPSGGAEFTVDLPVRH